MIIDEQALARLNDAWFAAFNGQDHAAIQALYMEDAVVIPINSGIVHGRAGAGNFWASFAEHASAVTITCNDRRAIAPDLVQEVGVYAFHMKDNHRTVSGKYLFVCRKDGTEYRICTHMWNRHLWD
jgi:uncharacterized protein (TIGR02246 family)